MLLSSSVTKLEMYLFWLTAVFFHLFVCFQLKYIWHITPCKFKVHSTNLTHLYINNLMDIVILLRTSIWSHNYLFFLVMGITETLSLKMFDDYNVRLLFIFCILCIKSLKNTVYYKFVCLNTCPTSSFPFPLKHHFTLFLQVCLFQIPQ